MPPSGDWGLRKWHGDLNPFSLHSIVSVQIGKGFTGLQNWIPVGNSQLQVGFHSLWLLHVARKVYFGSEQRGEMNSCI